MRLAAAAAWALAEAADTGAVAERAKERLEVAWQGRRRERWMPGETVVDRESDFRAARQAASFRIGAAANQERGSDFMARILPESDREIQ
jgi:hypothetical protein